MADSSDGSPEGTALREASEEMGLKSCDVEVWGRLNRFPDQDKSSAVAPILGRLSTAAMESIKLNHAEVRALKENNLHKGSPLGEGEFIWSTPTFGSNHTHMKIIPYGDTSHAGPTCLHSSNTTLGKPQKLRLHTIQEQHVSFPLLHRWTQENLGVDWVCPRHGTNASVTKKTLFTNQY